jgi:hypothetical protein
VPGNLTSVGSPADIELSLSSGRFEQGLIVLFGVCVCPGAFVDEFVEGWAGQRSGEVIALHDGAAERSEVGELGLGFDSFGDGGHS